jgi:hypothetical protein
MLEKFKKIAADPCGTGVWSISHHRVNFLRPKLDQPPREFFPACR